LIFVDISDRYDTKAAQKKTRKINRTAFLGTCTDFDLQVTDIFVQKQPAVGKNSPIRGIETVVPLLLACGVVSRKEFPDSRGLSAFGGRCQGYREVRD